MTRIGIALLFFLVTAGPTNAAFKSEGPPGEYVSHLACRIAERSPGPTVAFTILAEGNVNAVSSEPKDRALRARLPGGRELTASVQHVYVGMPRDRFNIELKLDGKPRLRMNHVDLDIYLETSIDDAVYLLHCFPDLDASGPTSNGAP